MTTDDDELDDASMKSMRAVWLTMRDEEPPSAGMSALLAAAREKAEQMSAKPSWFERTFGFLRKPPALAFATVMILIGGAVLVTRNTADEKTSAEISNAAPATPEPQRSRDDVTRQQMAPAADPEPTSVTPDPHAGSGVATLPPVIESPPPDKPTIKAKPKTPPKLLRKEGASTTLDVKDTERPAGNVVIDKTEALEDARGDTGSVRQGRGGEGAGSKLGTDSPRIEPTETAPPPPEPEPKRPMPVKESSDDADEVTTVTGKKPTTPPVEQLKNQAQSAASRGDCTAVKVIVARIKKQDESYYKTQVATNATIKKCL